jgi:type I restriction enzyme S subunit
MAASMPDEPTTVDSHVSIIRPKPGLFEPQFFAYAMQSIEASLKEAGEGCGGQTELSRSKLANEFPILFPEQTTEQQRIVTILDEAFDAIATAKANAEQNLRNSCEVFDSCLDTIFDTHKDGWTDKVLEQITHHSCSLSYGIVQPGDEYEGGVPVVRPTDLKHKLIELDGLKRVDPKLSEAYRRTKLMGGELLLCVRGATGAVSIASQNLAGANVTRGIVPIRLETSVVDPGFGFYILRSGAAQRQIREKPTVLL